MRAENDVGIHEQRIGTLLRDHRELREQAIRAAPCGARSLSPGPSGRSSATGEHAGHVGIALGGPVVAGSKSPAVGEQPTGTRLPPGPDEKMQRTRSPVAIKRTVEAGSEPESVAIAVIIRRDLAPVAAHLRDEFSGVASLVAVIIDRRHRDRRQASAAPSTERRHTDRRRRNVAEQLRDGGWAVIAVDDTTSLR